MSSSPEHSSDRYLFGPFELRPAERRLERDGVPLALGSRAMDVLSCLVERAGDVVSTEELLALVWRGLHVEPSALRVHVSAVRKALAEAGAGTPFISSVAGRGYCFVAPVQREAIEPAARSGEPAPPGLPSAPQRMLGRGSVVDALAPTVAAERLVTLVGPGGVGKTTVALALAHRLARAFDGQVVFVDLAVHRGDRSVALALAAALRLTDLGADPLAEVVTHLRPRRLLLVLDSCEHVIAGAATLAEAVGQRAPACRILATSREPLNIEGETVHRLEGLETPPASETMSFEAVCAYPAAQLFVERAMAGGGRIEPLPVDALLVADICRKLDGVPLAIELAAARIDAFGLEATRTLLDGQLRLSWSGRRTAVPRHLTLNATLDWSYDLLSGDEARLLRTLSTFVGWFSLEAAEAVAGDDLRLAAPSALAGLVAKSLVSVDRGRTPVRYRLLDSTRDYARLKLERAGESRRAAAGHAAWILRELSADSRPRFQPPPTHESIEFINSRTPDAQAALDWSLSPHGDRSFAVPLTLVSSVIWGRLQQDGHESRRRLEAALSIAAPNSQDELQLNLRLCLALMDLPPYDMWRIETAATRALELAVTLGDLSDQLGARWSLWNAHILTRPNIPKAREQALLFQGLAGRFGAREQIMAELMVSNSELVGGNLAAARASSDRVESLGAANTGYPNTARVSVLWLSGMPDTAVAAGRVNLDRARATGSAVHEASVLVDACAGLTMNVGDLAEAARCADLIEDCVARGAFLAYRTWAEVLRTVIAARRGDTGPGRAFLAKPLPTECGHPRFAGVLTELALRQGEAGAGEVARDFADHLLQRIEAAGERWIWSEVQRVRGELARDPAEAEALFEAALALAQQQGARAWELRAATSLARRRPSAAAQVLKPLLASFTEGAATQDHVAARQVLAACGVDA